MWFGGTFDTYIYYIHIVFRCLSVPNVHTVCHTEVCMYTYVHACVQDVCTLCTSCVYSVYKMCAVCTSCVYSVYKLCVLCTKSHEKTMYFELKAPPQHHWAPSSGAPITSTCPQSSTHCPGLQIPYQLNTTRSG